MDAKQRLNARILELQARVSTLEAEYQKNREDLSLLSRMGLTEGELRATQALYSIFAITPENAMALRLDAQTPTIPLLERFDASQKEYLILTGAYYLGSPGRPISLVVKRARGYTRCLDNGLVMTDLKRDVGRFLSPQALTWLTERDRLHPLYSQLLCLGPLPEAPGTPVPFSQPCRLGGQTGKDRSGFGWEYAGDRLVHEGKPYGETATLLLIGILVAEDSSDVYNPFGARIPGAHR